MGKLLFVLVLMRLSFECVFKDNSDQVIRLGTKECLPYLCSGDCFTQLINQNSIFTLNQDHTKLNESVLETPDSRRWKIFRNKSLQWSDNVDCTFSIPQSPSTTPSGKLVAERPARHTQEPLTLMVLRPSTGKIRTIVPKTGYPSEGMAQ